MLTSDTSSVDFSNPIMIRTSSENGSFKIYKITVNPIFPLTDTGQIGCWDAGGNPQTCVGSGNDGEFTNTPNGRAFSGPKASNEYPNDYTTRNKVSGLLWKTCTEGKSGSTCSGGTATTQFWTSSSNLCSSLNSLNNGAGFAGKKNWRLPTILELASLNNYQNTSPTIDNNFFPQSVGSGYWSNTVNKSTVGNYQYVNFLNTTIGDFPDATAGNARCVSGNLPPNQSFTDNGDGTITDNRTSLLWQKCSDGLSGTNCTIGSANNSTWTIANSNCIGLTTNGKSWRLPNVIELYSIFDESISTSPYINSLFPNTTSTQYWSSTTYTSATTTGVLVYFNTGSAANLSKATTRPFRCVSN
ncbi:hypothetical protein LPTSP4_31910 [Leptospira ryugenii]|uniref:Lcl C-terminal domain-containing protein n=1 Tax=Leptospira ryugenii TaxID=1917863 RepID=A0A2P2E451_9LEPT|nr:hypothetical protein LPTSP4_31910 [Leptospira ryugenii]